MEIKCTPQELKELIENKKTPVEGTTDVSVKLDGKASKTLRETSKLLLKMKLVYFCIPSLVNEKSTDLSSPTIFSQSSLLIEDMKSLKVFSIIITTFQ